MSQSSPSTTPSPARTARRTAVQTAALAVGAVFVLVGVLGFIPGITTDFDTLRFASHRSGAQLLGLFQVSVLHNLVHVAFGVAGVLLARTIATAKRYLVVGGAVYLLLFVYGIAVPMDSAANVVPLDRADDVLHLGLGIGMVALGMLLTRRPDLERATSVATEAL